MKIFNFLFCIPFLFSFQLVAQHNIDGIWSGKIESNGSEIVIDIEIKSEKSQALISVPLQNISDFKSTSFSTKGDTLDIRYSMFQAKYEGVYDEVTNTIIGQWIHRSATPLTFHKVDKKTTFDRPQMPKEPFEYDIQDVEISNLKNGNVLAGTLSTPPGDGPHPLLILVTGSGPQTRDSEIIGHKPFWVLADYLSSNGIAVLRYDDRGFGKSTGNYRTATTANFADDAEAVLEYTKTLSNIKSVGILGHSEGSMIAGMVASRNKNVDFVISMAGMGVPSTDVMTYQNAKILAQSGMSKEGVELTKKRLPGIYNIINQDKEPKMIFDTLISAVHGFYDELDPEDSKLLAQNKASYYSQMSSALFTPWFRYFLNLNPTEYWSKVTCPVLAIHGSEDIQVEAVSATNGVKDALLLNGNDNILIKIFDGHNHLMQPCESCTISEYGSIPTTLAEDVMESIRDYSLSINE